MSWSSPLRRLILSTTMPENSSSTSICTSSIGSRRWPVSRSVFKSTRGREIAISALREWMATVGQAKSVAVAFIGKLKTVLQMIAIPLLLYGDELFGLVDCHALGTILIYIAAVLTVVSMLYYMRRALPVAHK